jgi:hypothetical protein
VRGAEQRAVVVHEHGALHPLPHPALQ